MNKLFLINWGEISSRFDPVYLSYLRRTKFDFRFASKLLSSLVNTFSGGTPSKEQPEYWNGNIQWASPKDFKEFYLSYTEDSITEEGLNNSSSKLVPARTLLMVVRSGILQHTIPVAVCTSPIAINQDVKALITCEEILPEFLGYYFLVFNSKILPRIVKHSTTVQSINTFELEKLPVPMPPKSVQQQIIGIMDAAYAEKKKKEAEAMQLLDSINNYLLNELQIVLPEESQSTLNSRMFYVKSSDLLGGRFDPRKYSVRYNKLFQAIDNSPYDKLSLREIITSSTSGDWGLEEKEENTELVSCITIRATEFDNKFNLNLDNSRSKCRKYLPEMYKKIALDEKDILIEKSGGSEDQPVGRVALIDKNILGTSKLAFSNFIHRIKIDENKALPEFVFEYLRLVHNLKITEVMQTQTNGIRNLIMGEYFGQTVLIPDLEKQKEIAIHASNMRKHAHDLETEAEDIVAEAKSRVEKILLEDEE